MDNLHGISQQVVLKIKKGRGFLSVSRPFVITATLDGTKLETNKVLPSKAANINTELRWEADSRYLKRLRKINTAFKIECYLHQNHKKLGYIYLNLRQAQIILSNDTIENENWHNFLGVPRELKCKPQILLVFKIQEATMVKKSKNVLNTNMPIDNKIKTIEFKMEEAPRKSNYLQIGPSKLCTKFYELCIDIIETGNLCSIIVPNEIGTPLKIQFHIMGMSLITKEFYGFKGITNKEKFKLQIKSEIQFLAAYFKQFPSLTFYLICGEKLIGSGSMDLRELTDLRQHFTASTKQKIVLRCSDNKDSHITNCLSPFVKVEITLMPMLSNNKPDAELNLIQNKLFTQLGGNEVISQSKLIAPHYKPQLYTSHSNEDITHNTYVDETIISCETIPEIQGVDHYENVKIPDFPNKVIESPPTNMNNLILARPVDIEPEMLTKKDGCHTNEQQEEDKTTFSSPRTNPVEGDNQQLPNSITKSPLTQIEIPTSDSLPKVYVEELATKYIEELEDWKEKQQEMYKFEIKIKTDKHLSKLSSEWLKKQHSLENELKQRLENCKNLKSRLEEALLELELKISAVQDFKQELQTGKKELDRKYTMKFKELRKASKKHQHDMEEKIRQSENEKHNLKNQILEYEAEISRLGQLVNLETKERITSEDFKKLSAENKILQEKLDKAIESNNYFKNECSLLERHILQIKED